MKTFDVIVVGLGGMGGAAAYHLARRGLKTLGIEQFEIGHARGSSHGTTRIIRRAYFEHPDYLPLLERSYRGWAELEQKIDGRLVVRTGLVLVGEANGAILAGVRRARDAHELDIEDVEMSTFGRRFPGFVAGEGLSAVFERDAGYLAVEPCVRAYVEEARRAGVTIVTGRAVRGWHVDGREVVVETDRERFRGAGLVLCAGAWTSSLLADLAIPLSVLRKSVCWFATDDVRYHVDSGAPVFGYDKGGAFHYGFPRIDGRGVKVGEHTGGVHVDDPDRVDRSRREDDEVRLGKFLRTHLPGVSGIVTDHSVCLYTMTPDGHFIVDRHPESERVFFAAGFSGHGFKFAPAIGSALADLVVDGRTEERVGFLSMSRFA